MRLRLLLSIVLCIWQRESGVVLINSDAVDPT